MSAIATVAMVCGFGVILGSELARALGVKVGEHVTLVAPGGQVTPAGVVPRLKQLTVVGLLDAGDTQLLQRTTDPHAHHFAVVNDQHACLAEQVLCIHVAKV